MTLAPANIVVAGHICLDVLPAFRSYTGAVDVRTLLAPGALIDVGPAALSTGGAVANTGLALHRLGVPTRLVGKVGDDVFGQAIRGLLASVAPGLGDALLSTPEGASSYSIVLSMPGVDRMFLHCPGANDTFSAADIPANRFADARMLHFGYPPLMRAVYADGGEALAGLFRQARAGGLLTSLDMAQPDPQSEAGHVDWNAWLERVLPQVDIFAPSIDELCFMLDRARWAQRQSSHTPLNTTLLSELAERVLALGAASVAIKLGDQGLYIRTSDNAPRLRAFGDHPEVGWAAWWGRELMVPCFAVDVVGTTGAGDATIAGLLASLIHQLGPEDTIRHAVAVGACAVEQADATSGVRPWPEIQARLAAGWARCTPTLDIHGGHWNEHHGIWYGPNDRLHHQQGVSHAHTA